MSQRTRGIHALLSASWAYRFSQNLLGARSARRRFVSEFVKPSTGQRLLDVGCGTGDMLDELPLVRYVGIDLSPTYIETARARYGDRGTFHVVDVEQMQLDPDERFEIVLAMGLLHHLDDGSVSRLCHNVSRLLDNGGRLLTIDPVLVPKQKLVARQLIRMDRGLNVRTETELGDLVLPYFRNVRAIVRQDLLRIPYSHVVLECTR